jgi:hypothetical protein
VTDHDHRWPDASTTAPAQQEEAAVLSDGTCILPDAHGRDAVIVLPGRPTAESGAAGGPPLRLWATGETAFLQGGFQWGVPEHEIRQVAAQRFGARGVTGTATRVSVGIADTPTLTLDLLHPDGDAELARTTSSGFPPYAAIVSATLSGAQPERVRRALAGDEGRLRVSYRGALTPGLQLNARIAERLAAHGVAVTTAGAVVATCDFPPNDHEHPEREVPTC